MRHPSLSLCLVLLLAGAASRVRAQIDLLDVTDGGKSAVAQGRPAASSPLAPSSPSATPSPVRWEWERTESSRRVQGFDLDLDTPAFENFKTRKPDGSFTEGHCWAYNLTIAAWFAMYRDVLAGRPSSMVQRRIASDLAVEQPSRKGPLARWRLRAFSREHPDIVQRMLSHVQADMMTTLVERIPAPGGQQLFQAISAQLSNRGRPFLLLGMRKELAVAGHSLLVYGMDTGWARSTAGQHARAVRFVLMDSNRTATTRLREPYLIYLPEQDRLTLPKVVSDRYHGADGPAQETEFFEGVVLVEKPVELEVLDAELLSGYLDPEAGKALVVAERSTAYTGRAPPLTPAESRRAIDQCNSIVTSIERGPTGQGTCEHQVSVALGTGTDTLTDASRAFYDRVGHTLEDAWFLDQADRQKPGIRATVLARLDDLCSPIMIHPWNGTGEELMRLAGKPGREKRIRDLLAALREARSLLGPARPAPSTSTSAPPTAAPTPSALAVSAG